MRSFQNKTFPDNLSNKYRCFVKDSLKEDFQTMMWLRLKTREAD